jgi:hypothetical protein
LVASKVSIDVSNTSLNRLWVHVLLDLTNEIVAGQAEGC